MMIEAGRRQAVGAHERVHRVRVLVLAEGRMRSRSHPHAVEDVCDLKATKLEAIDLRSEHAEHRRSRKGCARQPRNGRDHCRGTPELEGVSTRKRQTSL